MIETMKQNNIPFDQGNYQLIEYQDNYFINNNKKVKVKDIGKKVALTNAFFFDYLQEYHIPTAFLRKDGENALKFSNYQEFPFTGKNSKFC